MDRRAQMEEIRMHRVELLSHDNAFVDVSSSLKRSSAIGGNVTRGKRSRGEADEGRGGNDDKALSSTDAMHHVEDELLGSLRSDATRRIRDRTTCTSNARGRLEEGGGGGGGRVTSSGQATGKTATIGSLFPRRLALQKILDDQHKDYLADLEAAEGELTKESSKGEVAPTGTSSPNTMPPSHAMISNKRTICQQLRGCSATSPCADCAAVQSAGEMLCLWMREQLLLDSVRVESLSLTSSPGGLQLLNSMPSLQSTLVLTCNGGTRKSNTRRICGNRVCAICLRPNAPYLCPQCEVGRLCSAECSETHSETRCLKHVV